MGYSCSMSSIRDSADFIKHKPKVKSPQSQAAKQTKLNTHIRQKRSLMIHLEIPFISFPKCRKLHASKGHNCVLQIIIKEFYL